jgi:hypothetical protein
MPAVDGDRKKHESVFGRIRKMFFGSTPESDSEYSRTMDQK